MALELRTTVIPHQVLQQGIDYSLVKVWHDLSPNEIRYKSYTDMKMRVTNTFQTPMRYPLSCGSVYHDNMTILWYVYIKIEEN